MVTVRHTEHPKNWNDFMLREGASFLQSWEWGEAQKMQGRNVARIAAGDGNRVVMAAQMVGRDLPFGFSHSYVPFGPVIAKEFSSDGIMLREAARVLVDEARKTIGGVFLFCEPEWARDGEEERAFAPAFRDAGFRASRKHLQPERTLLIDLKQSEEELLRRMEKSARRNIGYAERAGVTIREAPPTKETARQLFRFLQTRAEAKEFFTHPQEHYEALAEVLGADCSSGASIRFFGAHHENTCVGMNAIVLFGKTAANLFSGVLRECRRLKAANLLRWSAMREAKRSGCERFDQWGISEKFPGVSAFKRGFGGVEIQRTASLHKPFNAVLYYPYRIVRE